METFSSILCVAGPLLAAVGGGILAVDAWQGPLRWYRLVYFPEGYETAVKESHALVVQRHRQLNPQVYSPERIEELVSESSKMLADKLTVHHSEQMLKDLKERRVSSRRAMWGFLFLLVGSVFQAVGSALS